MAPKKVIVVFGATGNQGGSVVNTFLGLRNWHVRAVTRKPSSEAAKGLAAKGAEVVQGDLADAASLPAPLAGATAVFLNTDFWEVYRPAIAHLLAAGQDPVEAGRKAFAYETACRKNAADAAAAVPTLERLVISSLTSLVGGSLHLDAGTFTGSFHSEAKNWGVEYIEAELPALAKKLSVIVPCAYNTNRLILPILNKESGVYEFRTPVQPHIHIPTIDAAGSTGAFVRTLIEDEEPGVKLLAYDSNQTMAEIVDIFRRATGKQAALVPVTTAQLIQAGGLAEVVSVVDYLNEQDAYEQGAPGYIKPPQLTKKVVTKSLEDWAKEQDWDALIAASQR